MAATLTPRKQEPKWRLNDGRVFVRILRVKLPETSDGKHGKSIFVPKSAMEAEKLGKGVYDANGRLLEIDKSCVFGRVVACGKKANRSTCIAEPDEQQGDFPLPPGTWVVISGAVAAYKPHPFEEIYAFNTSELQCWYLPTDPRPDWAPED